MRLLNIATENAAQSQAIQESLAGFPEGQLWQMRRADGASLNVVFFEIIGDAVEVVLKALTQSGDRNLTACLPSHLR